MTEQTSNSSISFMLDGQAYKQLLLAGMFWLEQHYQIVNQLNVFPVPDGDTGINMLLTMQSAYGEIAELDEVHVGRIARRFARGAVNGSRGNSGVILSQIWRGFAEALREQETLDATALANACQTGTNFAYDAAPKPPREGTILTVVREVSERVQDLVQNEHNLGAVFSAMVVQANDTLQRTPDMLPILKEAGVVDSGGQGLTYIFEGMLRQIRGESLETELEQAAASVTDRKPRLQVMSAAEFGHPYDVQLLLTGKNLDVDRIRAAIESMGDSAIVTSDGDALIKIHVHVYDPGRPISYAAEQGIVGDVVVENMYEQYLANLGSEAPEQATLGPTVELAPEDVAVIAVAPGEGLARVFYEQGAARIVSGGQTMNPSTEEIYNAILDLPVHKVILLPNNANVIMAAQQAVRKCKEKQVAVVASKTIPQGIAAMLVYANSRLHQDQRENLDRLAAGMTSSLSQVISGEVTTAVRSVDMDGVRASAGQIIGLLEDKLVVAGDNLPQLVHDLVGKLDTDECELVTLYYGNNVTARDAEALAETLQAAYESLTFEVLSGGQPHYFYLLSAE